MAKTSIRRSSPTILRMFAKELKARPGEYLPVPTYSANHSALVSQINRGHRSATLPPEEFEARLFKDRAYARYKVAQDVPNAPGGEVPEPGLPSAPTSRQIDIFETPEPRSPRHLAEVVAAADQLASDASLRADDMRSRGAERGATLMSLMADTHSAYARVLRGLTPTA